MQYKDAEISNTSHLNINYSEDPPATIRKVDNICIPNLIIYSRGMTDDWIVPIHIQWQNEKLIPVLPWNIKD